MGKVVILGVFVADTAYRADRMPRMGETIMGNSFVLGPGGKGSIPTPSRQFQEWNIL